MLGLSVWELLGWFSTVCVFSRFVLQWILSERARRSVAPDLFWWISLVGAASFAAYCSHTKQYVLLIGTIINGLIYARNILLARRGRRVSGIDMRVGSVLAITAIVSLSFAGLATMRSDPAASLMWVACAAVGQAIWSSRFVVQWWFAERSGFSHFPPAFWWTSLFGNLALLSYALHLRDPIYIASFLFGPVVQIRNITLTLRHQRAGARQARLPVSRPG